MPQIEVKFDIDANGIAHVTAKDLATNNEQKITISNSSGLSEAEIEQMMKDAELHAEEDKKRKEEIETRNNADSLVYQTEKTLKEFEGKIDDADKEKVEKTREELKAAIEANNLDDIKAKSEALTAAIFEVTTKMYQQAGPQGPQPGGPEGAAGPGQAKDNVVDADFEVVDDKDKK